MTIDTLAYAKHLEAAGIARQAAKAHAEAPTQHVLPDLVTKVDLDQAADRLEHRLTLAIEQTAHQQTVHVFGMTLGIVVVMNAILFALSHVVH
jgi:hypothetical protein